MGSLDNVNDDLPRVTGKEFVVKDSGKREEFPTGMVRDTQNWKSRPDLISPWFLERLGDHLRKGAEKYDARNWEKGANFSRFAASLARHYMQYMQGDKTEDHLSAMAFNIMCITHFEEIGRDDLNDMPNQSKNPQAQSCSAKAERGTEGGCKCCQNG